MLTNQVTLEANEYRRTMSGTITKELSNFVIDGQSV